MEITAVSSTFDFDRAFDSRSKKKVSLRLKKARRIGLYGLVSIACCLMLDAEQEMDVDVEAPDDPGLCSFISKLGFDEFLSEVSNVRCELPISQHRDRSDVVLELQRFRTSGDLIPLQDMISSRLIKRSPVATQALVEALFELGGNVSEHAHGDGVLAAFVSEEKRKNERIYFAIADVGIGLRQSFLRGSPSAPKPSSDHESIDLAVEYLVSSTGDSARGQGLSTTIDSVKSLGGTVTIRTGSARRMISMEPRNREAPREVVNRASVPYIRGTVVSISVPTGY